MKKHVTIIAMALLSLAAVVGCKKNNEHQDDPEPPVVVKNEYIIHYAIETQETKVDSTIVFTPCFKANVTYLEANGDTVKLTDVSLPWSKDITVTAPFSAYIKGNEFYDQSELPDFVTFGYYAGFTATSVAAGIFDNEMTGYNTACPKEYFLDNLIRIEKTLKFEIQKKFE